MAFPDQTYTDNESAAAALSNKASAAGLDLTGLNPIAQLQSAVANLLVSDPSTVTIPAGDVLSGTFGANKSGGADTGTYTFPSAVVLAGSLTGITNATFSTKIVSLTALATPSALAATAFNAFASTVSGGVLMGFGTTHDVALKNQAGTTALGIVQNSTTVALAGAGTFVTSLSSVTAFATPSALSATQFTAFASTVSGATLMGYGTTGDVTLKNRAGTDVFVVTSNTLNVTLAGALAVAGASTFTGGAQPASVGTTPGTDAAAQVTANGVTGGNTTIVTTGTGGTGGAVAFTTGAGGTAALAATAGTGGNGGAYSVITGAGALSAVTGAGTGTGGNGGAYTVTTGVGGAATTSTGVNVGGNSGAFTIATANGGAATNGSSNTGGNAGAISLTTGNGGAGATAAGNSGTITIGTGTAGSGGTVGSVLIKTGGTTAITVGPTQIVTLASALAITGALSGVTSAVFSTLLSSTTALATPGALGATALNAFASTVSGATLMGYGTTGDVTLKNRAGTDVVVVTANTTNVSMAGTLTLLAATNQLVLGNSNGVVRYVTSTDTMGFIAGGGLSMQITSAVITAGVALTVNAASQLGTAAGTDVTTIGGTAYGAGVASLRFNGLSTAAVNNQVGTLTNAPVAGNATFWMPISHAGTIRYIPCW